MRPSGTFVSVTVDVINTGDREGTEIAQLYLTFPSTPMTEGEPPRQLRGFSRVTVKPGERKGALFVLTKREVSVWCVHKGDFVVVPGTYTLHVGSSSMDLRLETTFEASW